MSFNKLSLYYSSLDICRAKVLFKAWLISPFYSRTNAEAELADAVRGDLQSGDVFAYASARGALASVLIAAGIGADDEVVLSGFTCLAVPTAVVSTGAKPIYLDIDPMTMNVTSASVIAAFGPRVRAVVLQHTMGSIADVDAVVQSAQSQGIIVIEDCALSIGSRRRGIPVGISGDAAIFSMELSKTISTGWGGVLVVHKESLRESVMRQYRRTLSRGILSTTRDTWQVIITIFFLYRRFYFLGRYACALAFKLGIFRFSTPLCELQGRPSIDFIAKMGFPQLRLAAHQWRRLPIVRAVSGKNLRSLQLALQAARLRAVGIAPLSDEPVSPRICFLVQNPERTIAWFMYRGVEVGRWFDGPLSPPPADDAFFYDPSLTPNAVQLAQKIVNLPSHCGLNSEDCKRLAALIFEYATEFPEDCL